MSALSRPRRTPLLLLAMVAQLGLGSAPRAQQAPDLVALGRQEFDVAQKEFNLGRYEAALEHFEASYRLTARPSLLYNIGYTYRQLFERSRKLELLELSAERFRAFLAAVPETDAASKAARDRAEAELKVVESAVVAEQAERARGEGTLEVGEELLKKGRLAEAQTQLERFLSATDNERGGVARAWMLDARLALAAGKLERAVGSFASALSLDRSRQLPAESPPATHATYLRAQEQLGDAPPLGVLHTPPGSLKVGRPIELRFAIGSDPERLITGLRVYYRAGDGAFSVLPPQPVGKVELPQLFSTALSPGARLDYYALVVDQRGAVLEHLGSAALPFSAPIERPHGPALTKRPWFWAVLGVSAAVVATGIGLAVHYTQAPSYDVPIQAGPAALLTR